ncbi:MAG: DsrE family protein [Gammaproteobacteria bacterium]|nr:DsrE family protein [Gammaproteobacteria bacterium]
MPVIAFSNTIKLFLILTFFFIALPRTSFADEEIAKVVYHADFDEPKRFSAMLQNVFNMTTTYENDLMDYDVRIVFLSKGIRFVTRDNLKGTAFEADKAFVKQREDFIKRLTSLQEIRGVKLELCAITLQMVGLDKSVLIPGVKLVTSGVVQIAKLQSQGFAYLKVE